MKKYELFFDIKFLDHHVLTRWDSKLSLGTEMTQLNKFEDLNDRFASLETRMTQSNNFGDRDDTTGQVWEPKQSICKFRDRDDTTEQI